MSDDTKHVTPDAPRTLSDKPVPPTLESHWGIAPNLTHGLRSEDFVRMQRDLSPDVVETWTAWVNEIEPRRKQGVRYSHFVTLDEMKAILSLIKYAGVSR